MAVSRRLAVQVFFIASAGLLPACPAAAQMPRTFDVGTRVRIRVDRQPLRLVGTIAEMRPDTLLLAMSRRGVFHWSVPVPDIVELEVSGGHRRLTAIGILVGAGAGMVLSAAYNGVVQSQCFSHCPEPSSNLGAAAIGGIAFGAALHFVKVERWLRIAVPK